MQYFILFILICGAQLRFFLPKGFDIIFCLWMIIVDICGCIHLNKRVKLLRPLNISLDTCKLNFIVTQIMEVNFSKSVLFKSWALYQSTHVHILGLKMDVWSHLVSTSSNALKIVVECLPHSCHF